MRACFIADLHIHSRFAYATSKNISLQSLSLVAGQKGIDVVGTGDVLHPQWLSELKSQLVYQEESGLYILKDMPNADARAVHFLPTTEISCVYRQAGKVHKVHNLILLPTLSAAKRLQERLAKIGNVASDGRPILRLSARDLLEIVLQTDPRSMLIPAHIWTPWYSMLGAKSGFDSIAACFADLAPRITAVETGLSSDAPMNRLCSLLDGIRLVSNSDAHSAQKLGRNATVFYGRLSYSTIYTALTVGLPGKDLATIDTYPQQGKYYLDGHRKCAVGLYPEASAELGNLCPVCQKPLTPGVLGRVQKLAGQRKQQAPVKDTYFYIIPLKQILSDVYNVGSTTKFVEKKYSEILRAAGTELEILLFKEINELSKLTEPELVQAIINLRSGKVSICEGYDGKFGSVWTNGNK